MKAILVIEMPECCADCPCSFFERSNSKLNLICGATQEDANNVGKPDWCPLKPMIEKKDRNKVVGDYLRGRCDGYNACIDEILGDKEEKMSETFYMPLTPNLRSDINNSIEKQMNELKTCQSNVFVSMQMERLRITKSLIGGLPDGYPIPMTKNKE